jgi:S-adenosylmethionine-diacylglycerol 3-amino-3-carboxypropyl transferase
MIRLKDQIRKIEFEARIFVSFGIVILICILAFTVFKSTPKLMITIGGSLRISPGHALTGGYVIVALFMVLASSLRIWAGSILTPTRMMAFKVQTDALVTTGPYKLVRNPIYLADLVAFCGFALCLPPVSLALPVLLYIHYLQLTKYEEKSLVAQFSQDFLKYQRVTNRIFPSIATIKHFREIIRDFSVNWEGIRHNGLYLLFIPGFLLSATTHKFSLALILGLPGILDWAIVHTRLGLEKKNPDSGKCKMVSFNRKKFKKNIMSDILYANCWEDPQIDRTAFNIGPDDVVFSITSGGCNVLTFLLDNPQKIIALDLNPTQNYLLELKIAAFRILEYHELLEFMGIRKCANRRAYYRKIRFMLSDDCANYWDRESGKIRKGLIHCGRYERYMKLLKAIITLLMGSPLIDKFFRTKDPQERKCLYQMRWENIRWFIFTRVLLSRTLMSCLFDKAFFAQLEENFSFGRHFADKAELALTRLPMKSNYFLSYILLGKFYSEAYLPTYLRRENFETIRSRVNRIQIVTGNCLDYFASLPDSCISKLNFTNIFEWMPSREFQRILKETVRVAKPNTILTYRNLLVFRERPLLLKNQIHSLRRLAKSLQQTDRSFIYNNYVVEKIQKESPTCCTELKQYQTAVQ